jgi:molybdopterin-guanine dinucleotide biosynthesis protein A
MLREVAGPPTPAGAGKAAGLPAGADVGLPLARGFPQPLAAAYRTSLALLAERLVAQQRLRPAFLFEQCAVSRLDEQALRADPVLAALDPDLDSVLNVNDPADYAKARARPAPAIAVRGPGGRRQPLMVNAATLAQAALAAGIALDGHVVAVLNDDQVTGDGQTPLAAGDAVFFIASDAGR